MDGINPCALATLIFLVSYLGYTRRRPREVLITGLLFGAGVFLAYLALGLGAFRALQTLAGFSGLSRLLYPAMALGTLALGVLSYRDYNRARAGRHRDMTLRLPPRLSQLCRGVIRRAARLPGLLTLAFFLGAAVTVLELFCTGQVYLPTLMYIMGDPLLRGRACALLLVYVTMFTLPVFLLTLAAYRGLSSARAAAWAHRHVPAVKLATAGLFLLLTVYLACNSVSLFWA